MPSVPSTFGGRHLPASIRGRLESFVLAVMVAAQTAVSSADTRVFPDLRDSHDPVLQTALDEALGKIPGFRDGVRKQETSIVVAIVTDLEHPRVAWYNPERMIYAASLPKIAIVLGALVEVDEGRLELDDELRSQLVNMVRRSSNRDATAVLERVGIDRIAEIVQDERYGKLYNPVRNPLYNSSNYQASVSLPGWSE